jgi:hypothetical protein
MMVVAGCGYPESVRVPRSASASLALRNYSSTRIPIPIRIQQRRLLYEIADTEDGPICNVRFPPRNWRPPALDLDSESPRCEASL